MHIIIPIITSTFKTVIDMGIYGNVIPSETMQSRLMRLDNLYIYLSSNEALYVHKLVGIGGFVGPRHRV